MLAYQGEAEEAGAFVAFRSPVLGGRVLAAGQDGFELDVGGDEPVTIRCRILVNAAGLHAPALARAIDGVPPETIPPAYFCRGVYFTLLGQDPVPPADLPGAGAGRARRPHHARPRRAGAVRPRCRMDPGCRLCGRSAPRRRVLRRGAALLAGAARRRAAAGLCRHPPEDQRPERGGGRFRRAGAGDARRPRSRQSLRHRIAGPDGLVAAGRRGAAPARPVAVRS